MMPTASCASRASRCRRCTRWTPTDGPFGPGPPRTSRAGTLSKILGAGVRIGWLCAPAEMIPAFQSFLFGGGVNPYMSRVATYFMRDNLVPHVQRLIAVYRAKRDAMLRGLDEVLAGTDYSVRRP